VVNTLPYGKGQLREECVMWILVNVAMLVVATLTAGAAAVAVYWLLLRATVEMMRPATVRPAPVRAELARGTAELVRAFTPRRSVEPKEGSK
jgi:hypothetical protein